MRAVVSAAALWGWKLFAVRVAVSFAGLLRLGEAVSLQRQDLVLPSDVLSSENIVFISIRDPKTRRRLSTQHVVLREPPLVKVLEQLFRHCAPCGILFPFSGARLRSRWRAVLGALGFSNVDNVIHPSCLRGSGATYMYSRGMGISDLQWLGRWKHLTTLESYLQEASAATSLMSLPTAKRDLISLRSAHTSARLLTL